MLFVATGVALTAGQANKAQLITTNKDKVLTPAVQGHIAPAQLARSNAVTWDGKSKLAVGVTGINDNLKIGDRAFCRASGDRPAVGGTENEFSIFNP
jgi:hypothetical protein